MSCPMPPKAKSLKERIAVKGTIGIDAMVTLLQGGTYVWAGDGKGPCFELTLDDAEDKCEFVEDAVSLIERHWDNG
jgi:hypothetical protein